MITSVFITRPAFWILLFRLLLCSLYPEGGSFLMLIDTQIRRKKNPNRIHSLRSNQNRADGARFCALVPQDEDIPDASFFSVLQLNIPEWPYIFVGTFCAMINGAMQPVFAILFSKIITVGSPHSPKGNIFNGSNNFFSFFFSIAGVCRSGR